MPRCSRVETRVEKVNIESPNATAIRLAAGLLRDGEVVAFPTETVYGLGANGLDDAAVRLVYELKGRPADNPVILHVADAASAKRLVSEWPQCAETLSEKYWPGPLTFVLRKSSIVPEVVTAGGPTVAVRVPAHPVALALLREFDGPIAAPSANRSSKTSPTLADHVLRDFDGRIPLILDAGPTDVGIESTVVDLTGPVPEVLRPGRITPSQIRHALDGDVRVHRGDAERLSSPGMLPRHYAPTARLILLEQDAPLPQEAPPGKTAYLTLAQRRDVRADVCVFMPNSPTEYAKRLYATLRDMDDQSVGVILVDMPPDTEEWSAVRDRLRRAAH